MVLSAALDNGYVFLALVAILTSVISAVYYLGIIKQVFFDKPEYKLNPDLEKLTLHGNIVDNIMLKTAKTKLQVFNFENVILSSVLTITISILTLIILLFIFIAQEWLSMANILALILFNP